MGLTTPYCKKIHVQKDIAEETGWPRKGRMEEAARSGQGPVESVEPSMKKTNRYAF
jgi:hypothetical protein